MEEAHTCEIDKILNPWDTASDKVKYFLLTVVIKKKGLRCASIFCILEQIIYFWKEYFYKLVTGVSVKKSC